MSPPTQRSPKYSSMLPMICHDYIYKKIENTPKESPWLVVSAQDLAEKFKIKTRMLLAADCKARRKSPTTYPEITCKTKIYIILHIRSRLCDGDFLGVCVLGSHPSLSCRAYA